jgi:signal transduction histidine kinase
VSRASIQGRLGWGLLVALIALFAVQWIAASAAMRRTAEQYMLARMDHDAESLLAAVTLAPAGKPDVAAERVGMVYSRPFSGHYFTVQAGAHRLRSRSLWDQDLPPLSAARGESYSARTAGPQGQPLLLLVQGFERRGQPVTIVVAENLSPLLEELSALHWRYGALSLAVLAALIAIQRRIVRSSLRPLEDARNALLQLQRGETARIDTAAPSEVQPLVDALNRLLALMEARLKRSRHALGNLSHALTGQLSLLMQAVDELRAQPAVHERLSGPLSAIGRLMERELRRARLAGGSAAGRPLNLRAEVQLMLETLSAIYRERGLSFECAVPAQLQVLADREDLQELLGNLLDNAAKWARSRVRVSAHVGDASIALRVEDDGPGCPPEQLSGLTARGARADESVPGSGLGLSIAGDIAEEYGSALRLAGSSALGGFLAEVELPADTPAARPG